MPIQIPPTSELMDQLAATHGVPGIPIRVDIAVARRTPTKTHYRASLAGRVLIESAEPVYATCRARAAKGLSGPIEVWHPKSDAPALRTTVQTGSRWAVSEGERSGPRVVQYRDFQWFGEAEPGELAEAVA